MPDISQKASFKSFNKYRRYSNFYRTVYQQTVPVKTIKRDFSRNNILQPLPKITGRRKNQLVKVLAGDVVSNDNQTQSPFNY